MAKKTPRQKAVKKCDDAFSKFIRERDNYRCYTCGGASGDTVMQCGHLITRGKYATRWDPDNARCQCRSCNMRHEYQPEIFTDKWISENGEEAYHELVRKSNTIVKFKTYELEEMAKRFTAQKVEKVNV